MNELSPSEDHEPQRLSYMKAKKFDDIDNAIKKEINSLVDLGGKFIQQASSSRGGFKGNDIANVTSWVTRLGQLIRKLYGENSQHFNNYNAAISTDNFYNIGSSWYGQISQVQGTALAVKHGIEDGLLGNIKGSLQADLFSDFLEIGEHLLQNKHKDAAAVIIGVALEDSLKKLCNKNGIETIKPNGSPMTMDSLNIELAKKKVYSKLDQKQITSWAHIRNNAAHSEYEEYDKKQVKMMLLFVQDFLSKHLS